MTRYDDLDTPRDGRRTSVLLRSFIHNASSERISIGDLSDVLTDRAYGVLMIMFALPNLMPVNLPGVSAVLGLPLILLSAQLAYGRPKPYFPQWLARRSFLRRDLERVFAWGLPYLERVERVLRPRLLWLTRPNGERLLGVICLVLSVAIVLPIPLGNWLPALALCILSMALIERDGVAYLIGIIVASIGLVIVGTVAITLVEALLSYLPRMISN
ncbi:MAG TPA: exopolysaccharide biosynthesis protein [Thermohalobaculum sp.]|nr:exopolysaccharide biosynthesis protein [Thermohalobaculum sp.]